MKSLWKRRSKTWILAACFLLSLLPLCCAEDEAGFPDDIPVHTIDRGKSTPVESAPKRSSSSSLSSRAPPHPRHRRQAFDGFRFSDIFRIFNSGALEGVDSVLRSTRNFDVFQCLERISCEMAAPLRNEGNSDHESEHGDGQEQAGNPGLIQTIQSPFFQPGFQSGGQFIQIPQSQFVTHIPIQQGFQQFPVAQTGFQQIAQPAAQFIRPANQFVQAPQQQFAQQSVQHFVQQPFPGQQSFRHGLPPAHLGIGGNPSEAHIKRSDERGNGHQERQSSPSFFDGYRNVIRRSRQRDNWFNRMLNRFGGKRKKRDAPNVQLRRNDFNRRRRGLMDTLQRLWGGKEFVGVLDRMMAGTDDSLYPYTRAALMGYTGNTETCEQLYPECPTSMDEVIDTFNNLRSYFPNGVPFRDRIPAPLRYLIP